MNSQTAAVYRELMIRVSINHSDSDGFCLWPKCNAKSIMGFKGQENDQIWTLEISP